MMCNTRYCIFSTGRSRNGTVEKSKYFVCPRKASVTSLPSSQSGDALVFTHMTSC